HDHEFIVLVGPSGCGKSTTLRMIAGLEEISEGTITIGGRIVNDIPPKDRDIAMVFQNYALYPHMTVYDNMAFGLKLRKFKKDDIRRRVMDAAAILGIEEYLNRRPKQLSGGQRQRVAVGRAIVRKPEAFLFDEPLSNLDAKMRVQMRAEISKLHTQLETTMIYVTHDQTEAMTMGDRICVIKDGSIQQAADPITLYDSPENIFVAGFIGTPPMNFFTGTVIEKNEGLTFRGETFEIRLPNEWLSELRPYLERDVILGIRPEDICWAKTRGEDFPKVKADIEVIEPMGAETYLYVNTGTHSFIARVESQHRFKVGETVELPFFMPKAHIFCKETEKVIV
ncbi:MAG: sn-glycerol-3-phosphate ABC transporter ATP-binding protein UgpC, partial [Victivallales bacterium]|nr:sn-glycerol-3-phosphate ABC transporter ATP-binding protein UgpC [Victivallales bacterium]